MCYLLQQKRDHQLPFTCAQVLLSSIWCDATCEGSCHPPPNVMTLPPSCDEGGKQGQPHTDAKWMLRFKSETKQHIASPVTLYYCVCLYYCILQDKLNILTKYYPLRTL